MASAYPSLSTCTLLGPLKLLRVLDLDVLDLRARNDAWGS